MSLRVCAPNILLLIPKLEKGLILKGVKATSSGGWWIKGFDSEVGCSKYSSWLRNGRIRDMRKAFTIQMWGGGQDDELVQGDYNKREVIQIGQLLIIKSKESSWLIIAGCTFCPFGKLGSEDVCNLDSRNGEDSI